MVIVSGLRTALSERIMSNTPPSPVRVIDGLAELVCSNSFRSDNAEHNAGGLLHEEMRV